MSTKLTIILALIFVLVNCAYSDPPKCTPNPDNVVDSATLARIKRMADTCPCVKPAGSDTCVAYDPQVAAATLEEAMANFADPKDPSKRAPSSAVAPIETDNKQKQQQCAKNTTCRQCNGLRLMQLSGLDSSTTGEAMKAFGITAADLPTSNAQRDRLGKLCNSTIYQDFQDPTGKTSILSQKLKQLIDSAGTLNQFSNLTNLFSPLSNIGSGTNLAALTGLLGGQGRKRRQAGTIGTTYQISCVNRGAKDVNAVDDFTDLCTMCWAWRVLPADYFPRYINELQCTSDTRCLQGYGECKQRYRQINVLQNHGTTASPSWVSVTVSSATSCDCRVKVGSALYGWISS